MPLFTDHEETQLLDDGAYSSDGDSHSSGGTLEIEDSILYGETQAVDDENDIGYDGIETQTVDDFDENEARVLENGADSDASTDDGDNSNKGDVTSKLPPSGGSCKSNGSARSIASVRAASLRSSGLSAAENFSISNSASCSDLNNGIDDLPILDAKENEIDEGTNLAKNRVVKKLTYAPTATEEENFAAENNAGLSYVQSQEPGELTQANALDVVDNFLAVNYLGLSQEANNSKKHADMVKSPPASSKKGAQLLVKTTDYNSPVGKSGTYEWIDSLEDEGGGEFFSKRRDSFFKNKDSTRKPRSVSFGIARKEGTDFTNHKKIANLTRSDSRLTRKNSLVNGKADVSETRTRKSIFQDLNEQSSLKYKEKDNDSTEQGTYEVGPDTQMAAEVLEELVNGSPSNKYVNDAQPTPNVNCVATRSDSKQRNPIKARRNISVNKSLKCTGEKAVSKRGKRKLEKSTNAKILVSENDNDMVSREVALDEFCINSTPIAHRTRHSKVVKLSNIAEKDTNATINTRSRGRIASEGKLVTNTRGSGKSKRKCSDITSVQNFEAEREFSRQDIECQHIEEPKAHPKRKRTMHTKANINIRTRDSIARDDKLVTDASGSIKSNMKCSDIAPVRNSEVEREFVRQDIECQHMDEPKPKAHSYQKRTRNTTLDNSDEDGVRNPPLNNDSIQPKTGKRKITVKTISEILDAAKRKRRTISTFNGGKDLFISSGRTISSLKSPSYISNVENDSKNCSASQAKQGAKESGKAKESLKLKQIKNVDAESPVCVARDNIRTPSIDCKSRSLIARELIRLETKASSPTSGFNTRRRRDMASVRVLFSNHLDDDIVKQQKKIMGRLGIPIASSILDATHFVTDSFVRTRNMLEAMVQGKPVVTHMWLESCGQASCFIDEKSYIMRDSKKEKEIGFSMPVSLAHACQNPLLQGKRVYITKNIKPSREVISSLVKAAHGQPLERLGRSAIKDEKIPHDLLVLSCEEDYNDCIPFLEKGAEIFSSELLLNGIVIQKLEYDRHRLFLDHVRRTRSAIWLG